MMRSADQLNKNKRKKPKQNKEIKIREDKKQKITDQILF